MLHSVSGFARHKYFIFTSVKNFELHVKHVNQSQT